MAESTVFQSATKARVAAAGLLVGRGIDHWSLALTVLALAAAWVMPPSELLPQLLLLLVIVAGSAEKLFALRVAFDASLFAQWAESWKHTADPGRTEADLAALDVALAACGLRANSGEVRDLDRRLVGAFGLLRRQFVLLAIQFVAWLAALLASGLPAGA